MTSQRQTQSKMAASLVVDILVFDLRVQIFALIKVNTFICKREISGFSSPLISNYSKSSKLFLKILVSGILKFFFIMMTKALGVKRSLILLTGIVRQHAT